MLREANWRSGEAGELFYRLRNSLPTVGPDRDLNRSVGISVADRRVEMDGMCSQMIQVSGGIGPDRREPMASEEEVGQGDWSA